ncbi:MAG: glutaredoxin family protein [Cyanobacteria bacterium REEB459]|nr:glutaredoxin family protein [Cyanobacteria bacterium REEB459]
MTFVLYSKPGCHLCEGLEAKLRSIQPAIALEVRDITSRDDWWQRYQYEVPVLCQILLTAAGSQEIPLPRPSPRLPQARLEELIQRWLAETI